CCALTLPALASRSAAVELTTPLRYGFRNSPICDEMLGVSSCATLRVRSAAASKFQGDPLRFAAPFAARFCRPFAGATRLCGSAPTNPPTRPATFWVRSLAHCGTTGVVVELNWVFEVLLVLVFEPPIFKLMVRGPLRSPAPAARSPWSSVSAPSRRDRSPARGGSRRRG